ncbi:MAG: hypothetical protein AAFR23_09660, partial [Pseudomonadota bacterium]
MGWSVTARRRTSGTGSGDDDTTPLPPIRSDLELSEGAPSAHGKRTWLIYDPSRHRFIQVDEVTRSLIACWPSCATSADLKAAASLELGLSVDDDMIKELIEFVDQHELIVEPGDGGWRSLSRRANRRNEKPLLRFAHTYLFFRIPLVRPQVFLERTLPYVSFLFTRGFAAFSVLCALTGLYLVSQQWQAFLTTAEYAFSWQGAIAFAITLVFVKAIHELAHAYVAVSKGAIVPTIGVAFMLLFPLLYTDVTDTWRLKRRRDRLAVDAAGLGAELAIAAIATVAWAVLPDGALRSVAFMLATVGWLLSLLINANPFMRFDGYYLLADATGIENLQTRSFNVSKWRLREYLFDFCAPCPENFSSATIRRMELYGYGVWIYRLFLFIGIAILVYVSTFKVLGILLFILEIVLLVAKPIFNELKVWWDMRALILRSGRAAVTASVIIAAGVAIIVPWS